MTSAQDILALRVSVEKLGIICIGVPLLLDLFSVTTFKVFFFVLCILTFDCYLVWGILFWFSLFCVLYVVHVYLCFGLGKACLVGKYFFW